MKDKENFEYFDDGFYQFISEFYPNNPIADRIVEILNTEFSDEKINYLIMAEILLILNRIDQSFANFVYYDQFRK